MKSILIAMAMPLLATGMPPVGAISAWLEPFVYLAGAVFLCIQIWRTLRAPDRSPTIDVELTGLATKESVTRLEIEMPKMATKAELGQTEHRLIKHSDAQALEQDQRRRISTGNLHGKIDGIEKEHTKEMKLVLSTLAKVAANQDTNTAAISETGRKMDVLLERSVRTREDHPHPR